jgi:hypothetical protein
MLGLLERARSLIDSIREHYAPDPPNLEEGLQSFLKQAMPTCTLCGQPIQGHEYQEIASLPYKDGYAEKIEMMAESVRLNRWEELSQFQEWEGIHDDALVWLFRCPDGRYNLTIIFDAFELWDNASLLRHKEVNADDLPILMRDWKKV